MEDLRVALTRVAARAPVPTDFKQLWARLSSGLPHPHHGSARSRWFRLLQRILIPQQPVWVPAALAIVLVAAVGVIWQIRAPMHEKSNTVIIDYIESQHSSVMIVQPENPGDMTVIWIFEEMNKGTSA